MAVVAQGVVELIPSAKGFSSKIQKEIGGDLAKAGEKQGRGLGSKVSRGFGLAAKAGFGGAAALAGTALVKGFGRLKSIDDAEGKLRGLGHSSKTVDGIMKNALGSVKGTAFGLDEAATTAAGSVAAGIKPGKELESTLALVADAATIGGTSMSEMGGIFNKVASSNKVQGDVINQLNERGIPIVQMLAKEMGVTEEEVYKLSQAGQIGFDDFRNAMESGLGGAAQEGGKTFSGAMANAGAALGRLGASFLSGVFPHMKTGLNELTGLFDRLGPTVEAWGAKMGVGVKVAAGGIGSFISDFRAGEGVAGRFRDVLSSLWSSLSGAAVGAFNALKPHFLTFVGAMRDLWPAVQATASVVGSFLMAAFRAVLPYLKMAALVIGGALVGAMKILPPILSVAMGAFRGILGVIRPLLPVIAAIGAALLTQYVAGLVRAGIQSAIMLARTTALRIAMAIGRVHILAAAAATRIHAAAQKLATLSTVRQTIAEKARAIAMKVGAVATKAMAIAQRVLNAAMRANPIGLLITGLLLLGAGLVLAYKKSETFRRIVNGAWAGIKAAVSSVTSWFTQVAWPAVRSAFQALGRVAMWLWRNGIQPAFRGIGSIISWWYTNIVKRYFALVRTAFQGVASVARWLWRNGIQPAFRGISSLASWLWGRIRSAFNYIRGGFQGVARIAKWLWTNGIRPTFQWIADRAKWLWRNGIRPALNFIMNGFRGWARVGRWLWGQIKEIFGNISARAKWLWGRIKFYFDKIRGGFRTVGSAVKTVLWERGVKPAFQWIADRAKWLWRRVKAQFDNLRGGLRKVREAFKTARDKIGTLWGGILDKIKRPIGKAMRWLQNNFVSKLNAMLGKIPGIPKAGPIPNLRVPAGYARGGWTGSGSRLTPAGIVHADEFVVKKSSRRKFERENPGALDHINRSGRLPSYYRPAGWADGGHVLPGYATGGPVDGAMAAWFRRNFPRDRITSAYRPGSRTAASNSRSYHSRARALDMSPKIGIFNKIKKTFGTAIRELIFSPAGGRQVHNGRNHRYTGITRAMHWDHVHWAMESMNNLSGLAGSLSGGGGFDLPDWAANPLKWVKDKISGLTKGFDASKFGLAGKALPAVFDWVRDGAVKALTGASEKLDVGGFIAGAGVQRWRGHVNRALDIMGQPRSLANVVLNQIRTESGGNPRAINRTDINARRGDPSKGLLQVIGSTYRAYRHPRYDKGQYDPMSNILASMRYAIARYGSLRNAYRGRAYETGTDSAKRGLALVGEQGPELVRFGGGEQVFTRAQTMRLARSAPNVPAADGGLSGPVTVIVKDRDGTFVDRMRGEIEADRRQQRIVQRLGR